VSRFLILFVVLLLVLSFLGNYPAIRELLIDPWNEWLAIASYWIIHPFDAGVGLTGNIIYPLDSRVGGGVSIESGCNGVEAIIILISAIAAFPSPWLAKILGIVIGAAMVQLFNLARIISLFYLVSWNQSVFEWFHHYIWPILIIIDALVVFFIWTRLMTRRRTPAAAA